MAQTANRDRLARALDDLDLLDPSRIEGFADRLIVYRGLSDSVAGHVFWSPPHQAQHAALVAAVTEAQAQSERTLHDFLLDWLVENDWHVIYLTEDAILFDAAYGRAYQAGERDLIMHATLTEVLKARGLSDATETDVIRFDDAGDMISRCGIVAGLTGVLKARGVDITVPIHHDR